MGSFLAVSAFRDRSVSDVANAIISTMSESGAPCHPSSAPMQPQTDVALYSGSAFTIVLWPEFFNAHDIDVCRMVTARLRCPALTSHAYDGDYWTIVLCRDGAVLDRFCSHPGYFAESSEERSRLAQAWKGDAGILARACAADPGVIARYLVHQDDTPPPEGARAWPDDEFELSNLWVFTDLWRRLGARYPDDVDASDARLRLPAEYSKWLPTDAGLRRSPARSGEPRDRRR